MVVATKLSGKGKTSGEAESSSEPVLDDKEIEKEETKRVQFDDLDDD